MYRYTTTSLDAVILGMSSSAAAFLEDDPTQCGTACRYILNNAPFDTMDVQVCEKLQLRLIHASLPYMNSQTLHERGRPVCLK